MCNITTEERENKQDHEQMDIIVPVCNTVLSRSGNCTNVSIAGIDVNIPPSSASDFVLNDVGCRSGYVLRNSSTVRNVTCLLNGNWSTFPDCDGQYLY